jgi:hypothetical protein
MNSCYTRITDYQKLIGYFKAWPSFDDFEIDSMQFERSQDGEEWPTLTVQFLGVGPEEPTRMNCLVTIRFGGLQDMKLDGFNHQNAINGLSIVEKWSTNLNRELFKVEIIRGFGVGAIFECSHIEVLSVSTAESGAS